MSSSKTASVSKPPRPVRGLVCLLAGTWLLALSLQMVLGDSRIATQLVSHRLAAETVSSLGGEEIKLSPDGHFTAELNLARLLLPLVAVSVVLSLAGSALISIVHRTSWTKAWSDWAFYGWLWWLLPGLWETVHIGSLLIKADWLNQLLYAGLPYCYALMMGGWLATLFTLAGRNDAGRNDELPAISNSYSRHLPIAACVAAIVVYVVVFTAMNWQLYRGLLLPHGDSAMYEEHLWNLTHGKGFRSYLDGGLFLGEHIQVVHVLLVPLHFIWPSHLLLELCESAALASGAMPVFWMARRQTNSSRAALLLAVAYLLYFPMQFLDISIDLKTFRPIAFGIPAMLFAFDQLQRRRYGTMACLMVLALAAKEDYAMIIAPLGIWIALCGHRECANYQIPVPVSDAPVQSRRVSVYWGLGIAVAAVVYLLLTVTVIIPWFRGGAEVHYSHYFGALGASPGELIENIFKHPGTFLERLLSVRSVFYAVLMLMPLAFVPLFSMGRMAVAMPVFCMLCLLELSDDPGKTSEDILVGFHHFHAPLVPVVLWAAAAGLNNVGQFASRCAGRFGIHDGQPASELSQRVQRFAARFACAAALTSGVFISFGPLGLRFWDSGSFVYWRDLYVPGERARAFEAVEKLIPLESYVASTDFVHPRFTHHARSYDYSMYPRAVNDNKSGAPPDTDYIVIDTQHKYSAFKTPGDIPEYRDHPDDWKLIEHGAREYFIVLKRRWPQN